MIQVYDKYGKIKSSGIPGFGTVTAVSAGNLSPLFTTAVTSPTSTPNIAFTLTSQTQKLFFASPNSGSGTPTFRTIQASDLPSLSGTYVPVTRNLTINGVTYDLSADRTWTINSLPSQTGNNGKWLTTDGTNASWQFLSGNISLFTNDSGYLTSTSADLLYYPLSSNPAGYLTSAITSLGGLTAATQTFATGTSGTDFNISSVTSTHTFNLPTASAVNTGKLSSTDWTTFNGKQDALVSGTNIRTIDDLAILGAGNLEYISNLIHRQGLSYAMCNINVATYLTFRTNTSVTQSGSSAISGTPPRMAYKSAATAGSLTWQRGTMGGVAGSNWWYSRKFEITCNISDSRFVCGLSTQFQLANPTNVEPDTLINIAGVCKLSTSNNLHFFHNDGSGLATTVDLGTNYPANNATAYTYLLELDRDNTSTLYFKLTRTDTSGNKISTTYTTTTNYAGLASSVIYGTNNATASAFSFNDYGILIKNREDQWNTL